MRVVHEYRSLPAEKRPQDPSQDGRGWKFETLEHGGEYPDTMPQAIRATDPQGRWAVYVPIKVDGEVADSGSGPSAMPASPPLARTLTPRDHAPLVTIDDASRYMMALPADIAARNVWQHAAALAIDARDKPTRASIEALTVQLHLALFTTYRLDF